MDKKKKEEENEGDWNSASMIKAISGLLIEIINENKSENTNAVKSVFTAKKPPSISINTYLDRIVKYTKIEESTLILTLIFIDRLCDYSQTVLRENNIHRVILACVLLSIKYNEDDYYSNEFYSRVGGVSLEEINTLELEALVGINHRLFVEENFFNKYRNYLLHYLK